MVTEKKSKLTCEKKGQHFGNAQLFVAPQNYGNNSLLVFFANVINYYNIVFHLFYFFKILNIDNCVFDSLK